MLQHTSLTLRRIEVFAERLYELIYPVHLPLVTEYAGPVGRISYAEAQKLEYRPAEPGLQLGPLWATFWFRLRGRVPKAWAGRRVDLIWVTHSEGTVWRNGQPIQGVNYEPAALYNSSVRSDVKLWQKAAGGEEVSLEVEVACNQVFGYDFRELRPYKTLLPFVFEQADLAVFDQEAWDLYLDYLVLADILKNHEGPLTPWTGRLLGELNQFINEVRTDDRTTWAKARARLQALYRERNASYTHEVSAIGHAHIDTAWLWPLAETKRKCVRTFSTALSYMEDYPEYKFSCSQAFQYAWIKDEYPELYAKIKAAVKRGQWVPVGGCWIEPDCNIPGGESLVRQFLYGKRFFREEFGVDCKEFWNPDVFGYSGALPQIIRGAGIDYFLTQKLCYNQINKPMHHSFLWEGIDGTRVLTHFPPADTYNGMGVGFPLKDLLYSVKNFKDHDRSNQSLFLYGYGDGGGGPTKQMIEVMRRIKDVQGVPRTEQRTPAEFFGRLEKNLKDAPVHVGELYFEWHRGTYTTQANNKLWNRRGEFLLRDVELLSRMASLEGKGDYPAKELEATWKLLLLNQFHDIIPGSSIREVYLDSDKDYAHILQTAGALKQRALESLARGGAAHELIAVNTFAWDRRDLVELPDKAASAHQVSHRGQPLRLVAAPACGIASVVEDRLPDVPVTVCKHDRGIVLENHYLRAEFETSGRLVSLFNKETRRETMEAGRAGNRFVLFDDRPIQCDAWDVDVFHLETREEIPHANGFRILEEGPLRAMIQFEFEFGASRMVERVSLAAHARHVEFECDVNWCQRHQLLKVQFPVAVRAQEASYEIQFGYLKRSTHFNTSYDIARFESSAHRWIDLSEPGCGVALLSDAKYGYSVHGGVMSISLLRAPTHPDPEADQGEHKFRFACYPHGGDLIAAEVVRRGYEFNWPLTLAPGRTETKSWWRLDSPHLILDTVKKAEDSNATVVRLYETHGVHGSAVLETGVPFGKAWVANLLEEKAGEVPIRDGHIIIDFRPFQIITLVIEK